MSGKRRKIKLKEAISIAILDENLVMRNKESYYRFSEDMLYRFDKYQGWVESDFNLLARKFDTMDMVDIENITLEVVR